MDEYPYNNRSDMQGQCSRKWWSRLLTYQVQAYCRSCFVCFCLNFIKKRNLEQLFFFSIYLNTDSYCLLDYRQKCCPLQANWTTHLSSPFILSPWVSITCGVFTDVTLDSFWIRGVIIQDTGCYFPLVGPFPWRRAFLASLRVIRLCPQYLESS